MILGDVLEATQSSEPHNRIGFAHIYQHSFDIPQQLQRPYRCTPDILNSALIFIIESGTKAFEYKKPAFELLFP
ncbi:MAG: hypothetical protein KDE51_05695 [Anaerolineales bacterium]|nr:hypothetical protein [Anaerolineales bacterium]